MNNEENLAVFDLISSPSDGKFAFVSFPVKGLSLGVTLILLDFTDGVAPSVSVGRITGLVPGNESSSPQVSTNIDTTSKILGDPLVDTNGSFAGFLKRSGKVTSFEGIKALLNKGFSTEVDKGGKAQ